MRSAKLVMSALALVMGIATQARAVVIDFEDLVIPANTISAQPGNRYASLGITFSSGNMSPDLNAAIAVGDTFVLTDILNEFVIINNANSVSPPNFAGARLLGLQDTLMAFAKPISSLSLHSDDTPESGEIIRLIALAATGNPNEYEVLAFDEALDDATTEPDNLLSVFVATGFSYAIFQVTTEQEGFDDVTFVIPEPATGLLVGAGLLVLAARRRRSAPTP